MVEAYCSPCYIYGLRPGLPPSPGSPVRSTSSALCRFAPDWNSVGSAASLVHARWLLPWAPRVLWADLGGFPDDLATRYPATDVDAPTRRIEELAAA